MQNLFGENKQTNMADLERSGIFWYSFGGYKNSLKEVQLLIRPANYETESELELSQCNCVTDLFLSNYPESNDITDADAVVALDAFNIRNFNVQYRYCRSEIHLFAINKSKKNFSYQCLDGKQLVQDAANILNTSCQWNDTWTENTMSGLCICKCRVNFMCHSLIVSCHFIDSYEMSCRS
jgi:hypothetical protein